jgi:hypothetical protein
MARAQKLKVFRTPIGFHDAYVAAPSQKSALEAWGSDANLFARGLAEIVTDEALMLEPLEHPGEIIKRLRGSEDEHLAALPANAPKLKSSKSAGRPSSQPTGRAASLNSSPAEPKPNPRPSRDALEAAERKLEALERRQKDEDQALRDREQELQRERRNLERAQERDHAAAEAKVEQERKRHSKALDRWMERQA